MGYKCTGCGVIKQDGDDYWRVRIVTNDGLTVYVPTCSEECAKFTQRNYIALHQKRVNSIESQQFQRMEWGKYPNNDNEITQL